MVYTTGNPKRLVDSFNRWQRTKAFHKISEAGGVSVRRDISLETHGMQVDVEALCNQAARFGCQVRDSAYVERARAEGLELATLDGGMLQAARVAKLKATADTAQVGSAPM